MKYKNEEYRAREVSAHKGAVNLLSVIPWRIRPEPALMPPALRDGLNVPDVGLVIMPSAGSLPHELEEAVRETHATLLIIEPGETTEGAPTYYFTLVRSVRGEVRWIRALRLWVDLDRKPYLVPDDHTTTDGECFELKTSGVAVVTPPWAHNILYNFGIEHADAILLSP